MLPATLLAVVFVVVPLILGAWVSLTSASAGSSGSFVGLANYAKMLTDSGWHEALFNALRALAVLPIVILFPLVLAFALQQGVPFGGFFRATYFIGWLLPAVMVGYMFVPILAAGGPLNAVLGASSLGGFANTSWLGSSDTALWVLLAVYLWTAFGLGVGIYLAGLSTIPLDLYDAAKVDGAGFWGTLVSVTIPSILPTIAFWTVMSTGGLLLWLFPLIYSLTGGGPGRSTTLPEFFIWKVFGSGNLSYASALGIALLAIVLVFVLLQLRLLFFRTTDE
jgi:ABC-type sugar transport system permease subunit